MRDLSSDGAPGDAVLVKLCVDGDIVALHTYCRSRGRQGPFPLQLDEMREWLLEDYGEWTLSDEHDGSLIQLDAKSNTAQLQLWWSASDDGDGAPQGFSQGISLPVKLLQALLQDGTPFRYLYQPERRAAHIVTTHAAGTIRSVCADRLGRRAMCKALRDSFRQKGEIVTLYSGGQSSFLFATAYGRPSRGGLVLCETAIPTPAGVKRKLYYDILSL